MKVNNPGRWIVLMALAAALLAVLLPLFPGTGDSGSEQWQVYQFDAPVLRLHILAHSDAVEDQRVKEEVALAVCRFLQSRFSEYGPENWGVLEALLPRLEQEMSLRLHRLDRSMVVSAALVLEKFPLRSYGRAVYPAGAYPALKIVLGRGEGENWWCLLFPPLCLPVVEAQPDGGAEKEGSSDPQVLPACSVSSENPPASKRWVLKIRERVEHWVTRVIARQG